MSYKATINLLSLEGSESYKSPINNEYECVALVQALTRATNTNSWRKGIKVMDAEQGTIPPGTVIATFDEDGRYPLKERHAALYVSHNNEGIKVYHQYKKGVKPRKVHLDLIKSKKLKYRTTMDADYYYVVE